MPYNIETVDVGGLDGSCQGRERGVEGGREAHFFEDGGVSDLMSGV